MSDGIELAPDHNVTTVTVNVNPVFVFAPMLPMQLWLSFFGLWGSLMIPKQSEVEDKPR